MKNRPMLACLMRLSAVFLLAILLAGCSGGSTTSSSATLAPGQVSAPAGLRPPTLHAGDWWNYSSPSGGLSYVVSADSGDDYTMDTDSAGVAFFNAKNDISTLGAIRKSDLAGSQGKERVQFFQWPLTDGKNWTTTWDGAPIAIKAKQAGEGRFTFLATRADGSTYATYAYDNKTHWFTELTFSDAKGNPGFTLTLQASGTAFPGNLVRASLTKLAAGNATGPLGSNGNFEPAKFSRIYVHYNLACSNGAYSVAVGPLAINPVSGPGYAKQGQCSPPASDTSFVDVPAGSSNWGFSLDAAAPDLVYDYSVLGITLQTFAVGKAPA